MGMVIPLEAGWSDIGSWKTLWKFLQKILMEMFYQGMS